jgi:hypothetical protein
MKTLVRLPEGASTFLFQDTDDIYLFDTHVQINNPPTLFIADMNNQNTAVVENVTPPADWLGWKYLFDGITWTPNPIWVEPTPMPEPSIPE